LLRITIENKEFSTTAYSFAHLSIIHERAYVVLNEQMNIVALDLVS